MKNKFFITSVALVFSAVFNSASAQAPNLGSCAAFALFTSNGAVMNTGTSQITGHVGTNSGSSTGFGNVNGTMHDNDLASAQASADLLIAYNQLNSTIPLFFPAPLLGNGDTLEAGIYETAGASTLNGTLYLNAQGNANAVFILRIQGPLSAGAGSKVKLINGALACNVFWKVEGLVSMASGCRMKGTVIANNAAINMSTADTLEGRALSTSGAITLDGTMAYTPVGCGSPALTGPVPPFLGETECYAVFSAGGAVTNTGTTYVTGDVGTNVGLTTGFQAINVNGMIHPVPDGSTATCASNLNMIYNYLNALPYDIELLYPAQFGNNLVLTPHTYLLSGATTFTDTLFLNALGDTNAVFVLQIDGAFSTTTYSRVVLVNGAQPANVYWMIEGAVDINDYSQFKGTIVCNNGAIDLGTGVVFSGRAMTTTGNVSTSSINIVTPTTCIATGIAAPEVIAPAVLIYPNPVNDQTNVVISTASGMDNCILYVYNAMGMEVMRMNVSRQPAMFSASALGAGAYFYKVSDNDGQTQQSGTLIVQ
jgi:hypothetical protein